MQGTPVRATVGSTEVVPRSVVMETGRLVWCLFVHFIVSVFRLQKNQARCERNGHESAAFPGPMSSVKVTRTWGNKA